MYHLKTSLSNTPAAIMDDQPLQQNAQAPVVGWDLSFVSLVSFLFSWTTPLTWLAGPPALKSTFPFPILHWAGREEGREGGVVVEVGVCVCVCVHGGGGSNLIWPIAQVSELLTRSIQT